MSNYPWFAFYPADYLRKVGHLPLSTQGLWMWMLCRMDESPRRGVLLYPTGSPIMEQDIPAMVIDTPGTVRRALAMLEINGILSREEGTGAMYSRRMVRDTERRGRERDKKGKARTSPPNVPGNVPPNVPPMSPQVSRVEAEADTEAETETYPPTPQGGSVCLPNGNQCRGVSEADRKAAEAALDAWSEASRGTPLLPHRNELATVWKALEEFRDLPPVPTPAGSIPAVTLVGRAVQAKRAKGVKFDHVAFALGCVRTQLKSWVDTGVGLDEGPKPKRDYAAIDAAVKAARK